MNQLQTATELIITLTIVAIPTFIIPAIFIIRLQLRESRYK